MRTSLAGGSWGGGTVARTSLSTTRIAVQDPPLIAPYNSHEAAHGLGVNSNKGGKESFWGEAKQIHYSVSEKHSKYTVDSRCSFQKKN